MCQGAPASAVTRYRAPIFGRSEDASITQIAGYRGYTGYSPLKLADFCGFLGFHRVTRRHWVTGYRGYRLRNGRSLARMA